MMPFIKVLVNIAVFSVLVPLAVGLYQWHKGGKLVAKLVLLYVCFLVVVEGLGYYLGARKINNLWLSHVYIPIEYALLSLIYYFVFDNKTVRWVLSVSVVLFALFCVYDVFYIESMLTFNSYPRTVESALLIALALMYFNKVFQDLDKLYLERDPVFLLSAGIIIYFAGSVTFYGLVNKMMAQSQEQTRLLLSIIYVLNFGFNMLLATVLWRAPRQ
ncbi:hypothetical protein [Botryobacter ruber]|uniref:hypothetical protein n=1 Tax=Botryobacter ruber TaxID=2171629 RepID=UPI000E0B9073|nr:hypothetical protein [Botryobacter ruber]